MKKCIVFMVTVLLAISLCLPLSTSAAASATFSVTISKKKTPINLPYVSGTIEYPVVSGLSNKKVQAAINNVFLAHVQQRKKDAQQANGIGPDPFMNGEKYNVSTTYTVKRNKNGILSVVFLDSEYTGGAHGMYDMNAYTIQIATGKVYSLGDLFKKNSNYTSLIRNEIMHQLQVKNDRMFNTADFKVIPSNQRYYLTDKGIVIYFALYEYTPYVSGIPEYVIPYTKVKKYLAISGL